LEDKMERIVECVPNFSEGRDLNKVEKILDAFRGKREVKLLDYSSDEDHNRTVVTVVGEPEALKMAVVEAIGIAVELIDLNSHVGQHPRMGAVDVVPFIPIKNVTIQEADFLAKEVAKEASEKFGLPFFLYEKSKSVVISGSTVNMISPPFPPSPPSGPPRGTYFSLLNETEPFPPLPDFTNILALSTNILITSL
jgi:glutamate formiminotransferase